MQMTSEFGENLAEVVSESELSKIYIDLMAAIMNQIDQVEKIGKKHIPTD